MHSQLWPHSHLTKNILLFSEPRLGNGHIARGHHLSYHSYELYIGLNSFGWRSVGCRQFIQQVSRWQLWLFVASQVRFMASLTLS